MRKIPMDKIITAFTFPPIPDRSHDWCAYRENDVEDSCKYGWGRTEREALLDLFALEDAAEIEAHDRAEYEADKAT
jgi:hypothetical protein